jgi:uncharacterized NAD(P)/FAD-binding protein YdhS
MSVDRFDIAVIGGGFSGATVTSELLRCRSLSASVVLIGVGNSPGRGVAYGTKCGGHLLNVPAQKMSGIADDPSHFLRWAQVNFDSGVQPGDFLPRRVYGRYVESILREMSDRNPGRFEWRQDEATSLTEIDNKTSISLRSGRKIFADKVVLALGNFPPADPKFPGRDEFSPRYVPNPWAQDGLDGVTNDRDILLVGCGLTSVDVVITLRERGFAGKIHMLSRHGLLPQTHKRAEPWAPFRDGSTPLTARALLQQVRIQISEAERHGGDWRAVIDSLRPFSQRIWRSLPIREQQRFLRHLRAYWDVHRHRVAPKIGAMLEGEINVGNLEVYAGRIVKFQEDNGVKITYRKRGNGQLRELKVDRVINCTGPDSDLRRQKSPLLNDLLNQRLARTDELFLGLDTAPDGSLIGADGVASDFLFTLGPLRKGNLWETTAVPEIRVQAAELAVRLASSKNQPSFDILASERVTA